MEQRRMKRFFTGCLLTVLLTLAPAFFTGALGDALDLIGLGRLDAKAEITANEVTELQLKKALSQSGSPKTLKSGLTVNSLVINKATADNYTNFDMTHIYEGEALPIGLNITINTKSAIIDKAYVLKQIRDVNPIFNDTSTLTGESKTTINISNTRLSSTEVIWYECDTAGGLNAHTIGTIDNSFDPDKYYYFTVQIASGRAETTTRIKSGTGKASSTTELVTLWAGAFEEGCVAGGMGKDLTLISTKTSANEVIGTFKSETFKPETKVSLGQSASAYYGYTQYPFDKALDKQVALDTKMTVTAFNGAESGTHIVSATPQFMFYSSGNWLSHKGGTFKKGTKYRLQVCLSPERGYKIVKGYKAYLSWGDSTDNLIALTQDSNTPSFFYGPEFYPSDVTDPWSGSGDYITTFEDGDIGIDAQAVFSPKILAVLKSMGVIENQYWTNCLLKSKADDILKIDLTNYDNNVNYKGLISGNEDLKGLEYLTNLRTITIHFNNQTLYSNVTSLDLTKNLNLENVSLGKGGYGYYKGTESGIKLPSTLKSLSIENCQNVTSVNTLIKGFSELNWFAYKGTAITGIDFQNNRKLRTISIASSTNITRVDLPVNTGGDLTFNAYNCSNLETVSAQSTKFEEIDLEGTSKLKNLDLSYATINGKLTSSTAAALNFKYAKINKDLDFSSTAASPAIDYADFYGATVANNVSVNLSNRGLSYLLGSKQSGKSNQISVDTLTLGKDASLNLSNNPMECYWNNNVATTLNLGNLRIYDGASVNLSNTKISSINLNRHKDVTDAFYNVNLSQNTALTTLGASGGGLKTLNVSGCTNLTSLPAVDTPSTGMYLDCSGCKTLTGLPLYSKLSELKATNTGLTSLAMSSSGGNFISGAKVDLSNNGALASVSIKNATLETLNLYGCTKLDSLTLEKDSIQQVLAQNAKLGGALSFTGSTVSQADFTGCTGLAGQNYNFGSISGLKNLYVSDCNLKSLNVSGATGLVNLQAQNNELESLDLSKNTALTALNVKSNRLMSLDLSKNTKLTSSGTSLTGQMREVTGTYVEGGNTSISLTGADSKLDPSKVTLGTNARTWTMEEEEGVRTGVASAGGNANGEKFNYTYQTGKGSLEVQLSLTTVNRALVTFNANGGTIDSDKMQQVVGPDGKLTTAPPDPNPRDGYSFLGWFTTKTGGEKITTDKVFTVSTTVWAHWKEDTTYTFTAHAATPADCTNPGTIAYWVRSDGKWYSDAEGTHPIKLAGVQITNSSSKEDQEDAIYLPALGHDTEPVAAVESTCCQEGHKAYYRCKREGCGKIFKDEAATQLTQDAYEATPIDPDKHPETEKQYHAAVSPADCVTDGMKEYYECKACGKIYVDSAMTMETTLDWLKINAPGHNLSAWSETKAPTETEPGERERHCTNSGCTYSETATIPATSHVHSYETVAEKEPTCTEPGHIAYQVCKDCGLMFDADDTDKEIYESDTILPAIGHDMGEWIVVKEPTEMVTGIRKRNCKRDGCTYEETEVIPKALHKHVPKLIPETAETCLTDGNFPYYLCEDCGRRFVDKNCETEIGNFADFIRPATGHQWGEWSVVSAASDTEDGQEKRICLNDPGHSETRIIPAEKHEHNFAEEVPAKAATCLEEGNPAYCTCTKCDNYFIKNGEEWVLSSHADIVIPKTGHMTTKVEKKEPAFNKAGTEEHYKCRVCGKLFRDQAGLVGVTEEQLKIPALDIPAAGSVMEDNSGLKYKVVATGTEGTPGKVSGATVTVTGFGDSAEHTSDLVIPGQVQLSGITYAVVSVESDAFVADPSLKTVTFEGATNLGENAFSGCTGLEKVTLGDGTTVVGKGAFASTKNMVLVLPLSLGDRTEKEVKLLLDNATYGVPSDTPIRITLPDVAKDDAAGNALLQKLMALVEKAGYRIGDRKDVPKEEENPPKKEDPVDPGKTEGRFKAGDSFTVNRMKYKILSAEASKLTVSLEVCENKKIKKAVIDKVSYEGETFTVTQIAAKAFSKNKCTKLKDVTIGSGVTSIGKQAFANCKSLKNIRILSKSLKSVGKKAFTNTHKKLVIKVPKKKFGAYKKLLKKKGQKKTAKIKKDKK